MIVLRTEHVERRSDHAEIERRTADDERIRLHERVVQVTGAQVLGVHRGRHARRIAVPRKNVEGRRLLPHVPVRDDVTPDEIARAHPVERSRHLGAIEVAPLAHLRFELRDRRLVGEDAQVSGLAEVDERIRRRERADATGFAALREVAEHDDSDRAAQAEAGDVHLRRARNALDGVERGERSEAQVIVHCKVAHRSIGVAVTDHERLVAVLHRPFHERAPRREVHDVVLVDPRRAAEQRAFVDLFGLRRVCDQLDQLVAKDDFAPRRGEVLPKREGRAVDLFRIAAVVLEIVEICAHPTQQARAAGVDRFFDDRGVEPGKIARRHRLHHHGNREARLPLRRLRQSRAFDELQRVLPPHEKLLDRRDEKRIALPRRIAEAFVAVCGADGSRALALHAKQRVHGDVLLREHQRRRERRHAQRIAHDVERHRAQRVEKRRGIRAAQVDAVTELFDWHLADHMNMPPLMS